MDKSVEEFFNKRFKTTIHNFYEETPSETCSLIDIRDKYMSTDGVLVFGAHVSDRIDILVKNLDNLHVLSIGNLLYSLIHINSFNTDNEQFSKYYREYVGSPLMVDIDKYGEVQELLNVKTTEIMSVKTDFYSKKIPFISYSELYKKYQRSLKHD